MSDDALHALPGEGDRGFHMARRLGRTAKEAGVPEDARRLLEAAHALAMGPRRGALGPRDPRFLHPGRSALILLLDAGVSEPPVLAATLLVESEDVGLRVPDVDLTGVIPGDVQALRSRVPRSGQAGLAEALVSASEGVRLAALAERLDHLRHAHLWPERARRRSAHEEARAVYHPVALRTHPVLARRYAWWVGMFARRYLG